MASSAMTILFWSVLVGICSAQNFYQFEGVPQKQQAAPERASADQFYDEITSLANDLRRELQPINNDYQSLFSRFANIMSTYAQRVTLRLGDAFKDTQSVDEGIRSFFTGTAADSMKNNEVNNGFRSAQIVTDLLDVPPSNVAEISFSNGIRVNFGNKIFPIQTREMPSIFSWPTEPGAMYTIIMTDPAPGGSGEWAHWLVTNIPGTDMRRGETMIEYVPSGPPPGTGPHRYTFLVYKQLTRLRDAQLRYINNRTARGRGQFNTRAFVQRNRLGDPVAGNFFLAECDPFVQQVYAQLGEPNPGPCI